jgi:hypothetical protein
MSGESLEHGEKVIESLMSVLLTSNIPFLVKVCLVLEIETRAMIRKLFLAFASGGDYETCEKVLDLLMEHFRRQKANLEDFTAAVQMGKKWPLLCSDADDILISLGMDVKELNHDFVSSKIIARLTDEMKRVQGYLMNEEVEKAIIIAMKSNDKAKIQLVLDYCTNNGVPANAGKYVIDLQKLVQDGK